MTALDQAFTKVYRQQAASEKPSPGLSAPASPIQSAPVASKAEPKVQSAARAAAQPIAQPAPQPQPRMTVAAKPAAVMVEPAAPKPAPVGLHGKSAAATPSLPSCSKPTLPTVRLIPPGRTKPAPTLEELDIDRSICQVATETPQPQPQPAPATKLPESEPRDAEAAPRMASLLPKAAVAAKAPEPQPRENRPPAAPPQQTILRILRPATRIAGFHWPQICDRLLSTAGDQFHQLADALLAAKNQGFKVIAVSGCRRGEGATSVLLAAARRLTERGVRLAVVDADWDKPDLAANLELKVSHGWQGVLAGDAPLAAAVIEAADTRMAVLPLKGDGAAAGKPWQQALGVAETLETIAQNYDLVLVDAGPIFPSSPQGQRAWRGLDGCLDAAIVVQKVGEGAEQLVAESEQTLAAAGVAALGIVQNFVRD